MSTLQQWIQEQGLGATEWLDGTTRPTTTKRGTWNPAGQIFSARYGTPDEQVYGYTGDTAGAHGQLAMQALDAAERLGLEKSGGAPWNPAYSLDHYDLSMVTGASKRLLALSPAPVEPGPTPDPKPEPPAYVPLEIPPNVAETLTMPFEKWPPAEKKAQRGRLKELREWFNGVSGGLFVKAGP